jgi:hypothetical protein
MKNQQEQIEKVQPLNNSRFRNLMIMYLDILIRSLISFFFVGTLFSIFLIGFLHITWIVVIPLVFLVSILISPFLSKIKLGEKVFDYYEGFLKKTFKLNL